MKINFDPEALLKLRHAAKFYEDSVLGFENKKARLVSPFKCTHKRDGAKLGAVIGLIVLFGVAETGHAADRFTLTLNGEAVKDNKTGLVWEQAPDKEFDVWSASAARCATKTVGGQKAWRAPAKDELATLIEPDRNDPSLPDGHPFANIRSDIFWSSTPHPSDDMLAYYVSFFTGQVISDQKSQTRRMWCVLGKK